MKAPIPLLPNVTAEQYEADRKRASGQAKQPTARERRSHPGKACQSGGLSQFLEQAASLPGAAVAGRPEDAPGRGVAGGSKAASGRATLGATRFNRRDDS